MRFRVRNQSFIFVIVVLVLVLVVVVTSLIIALLIGNWYQHPPVVSRFGFQLY